MPTNARGSGGGGGGECAQLELTEPLPQVPQAIWEIRPCELVR